MCNKIPCNSLQRKYVGVAYANFLTSYLAEGTLSWSLIIDTQYCMYSAVIKRIVYIKDCV